jgi:hypothetical protein
MSVISQSKRTIFNSFLLTIGVAILLIIPSPLPAIIGTGDFRPYWTSTYLFAHGQDFSDSTKVYNVERGLTGWDASFPMYAWFAPTGNILLLPYILFDFGRAAYYWLVTNIVIVFSSALLIWQNKKLPVWVPLLSTFSFSMTLLSFEGGQVNTLVLLGLALYFSLSQNRKHEYAAGASLILTTVKAHLVVLALPILLLDILWRKQWRVLAGFAGALMGFTLILFFFYPAWYISFWHLLTFGMSFWRLTPTLPGVLVMAGKGIWGKWLWLIGLACIVVMWWKFRKQLDQRTWVDISILGGMAVSPVGWSYDQVILLFPLLHILEWAINGSLTKKQGAVIGTILIIGNAITYYQRIKVGNEVWFFWVPLFVAGVYVFARQSRQKESIAQNVI